jgi:hypothetical protein
MNEFPGYDTRHEETMRLYYRSLSEDHRRRYAAVEALKIGYGGVAYTSYRHKVAFLECLKFQCEQRVQLFLMRCMGLVKAIGNGVSEVGEIGVVFGVEDLFLDEFPEPFDEVQIRGVGGEIEYFMRDRIQRTQHIETLPPSRGLDEEAGERPQNTEKGA